MAHLRRSDRQFGGAFPYLGPMVHSAALFQTEPEELLEALGMYPSATEARSACGLHARISLIWIQPWEGFWEAEGEDDIVYRVTALLE